MSINNIFELFEDKKEEKKEEKVDHVAEAESAKSAVLKWVVIIIYIISAVMVFIVSYDDYINNEATLLGVILKTIIAPIVLIGLLFMLIFAAESRSPLQPLPRDIVFKKSSNISTTNINNSIQQGGKRLKNSNIFKLKNVLLISGIGILSYILYLLYNEIMYLRILEKNVEERIIRNDEIKENRDTIKIVTKSPIVGSINAGEYITTRNGYFNNNP